MILVVMLVKPIVWFFVFLSAVKGDLNAMLLRAAGVTVFLTLADKVSVASNLAFPAILLTLVLYAAMSFTLIPVSWKVKKTTLSVVFDLMGMLGAFVGVNFTMDFLRGLLPFMNR
jgi:small neutral amino acid transporter SnatA (MarC family)